MTDKKLLEIAEKMKDKSYAPYSGYRVGAALLCGDGSVITGCNVENISYSGTICAERTAFVKAVSEGKKEFMKLAVSVSGDEITIPCGICLQFLSEFVSGDFEVICGNKSSEYEIYQFSKLLPTVFRAKF